MGANIRKAILLLVLVVMAVSSVTYAEVRKEYYPSGQLKLEANFKDGKLEGIPKVYYEVGLLKLEGNFKDGKLHGITKGYYENGELNYVDTYKKGKKINRKVYDERGKLEFEQDYPTE